MHLRFLPRSHAGQDMRAYGAAASTRRRSGCARARALLVRAPYTLKAVKKKVPKFVM
jgi:hypothetical protein